MKTNRIRTILVDDDVLALTTMKMMIQVEHIFVVGEFTQAQEALDYVKDNPVDLMLTDMRMPKIDGIELIRQIKDYQPHIEVIAISSYKDFHYVKESLKEGSVDYILKHTLKEEVMTQALTEASKRIYTRKQKKISDEDIYYESREAVKVNVFRQLFSNQITPQNAEEIIRRHEIPLDLSNAVLVMCEVDDYEKVQAGYGEDDKRIFQETIKGIIEKVMDKVPEVVIVPIKEGRFAVLLSFTGIKSQLYIYTRSSEYCRRLNENVKKILGVQLSVSMGTLCSSVGQLKDSCGQCERLLENKFTEGKGNVYSQYGKVGRSSEGTSSMKAVAFRAGDMYQKLCKKEESFVEDLEEIFDYYKKMKFPMSVVELNIVEMLNTGDRVIGDKNLDNLKEKYGFQILYTKIKKTETVDEIMEIIIDFYSHVLEEVKKQSGILEQEYSKHTVKALRFMEMHYSENISLQEVAEMLGVHFAYLSKTFKADTGYGFSEYLNRMRIGKAKELIESGECRVKEIYTLVGFNQYNYFFKVFKQMEGCTPAEYEKKVKNI